MTLRVVTTLLCDLNGSRVNSMTLIFKWMKLPTKSAEPVKMKFNSTTTVQWRVSYRLHIARLYLDQRDEPTQRSLDIAVVKS